VQGGAIAEDVRPGLPLAEKLGRVFTALAGGIASRVEVEVRGEIAQYDVKVLELAVLKGIFTDVVEKSVTYVNAPLFAQDRGVEVSLLTDDDSPDFRNLITVRGTLPTGHQLSVAGTLARPNFVEKLVKVDGFDVDLTLSEHLAFFRYVDRPGVVGVLGRILGEHGINIAGMQVARDTRGGHALVALTVDSALPAPVLETIISEIGAESGRAVDLVEV
ncbi:MAG: D-3-phosphoglycerate dehydrogenase / 2-oxoglutarate reductase, partial [Actinomycetota bacterium]|nr:D-3-phosphoglycerate dehydrogenase / 2-oxoglutarate reductase [Actinomycetota bacterium]